jgi:UDPglucose 6-dehydrogenase
MTAPSAPPASPVPGGDLMRVAVLGLGVVGRAQVRLFGPAVHAAWDPAVPAGYPETRIAACDFAVVCAGTPEGPGGQADTSAVRDAVGRLPGRLPVLVRSTVPPGTMDQLAAGRAGLTGHWPEFLNERPGGLWQQPGQVPFQILGGDGGACQFFGPVITAVTGTAPWCCTLLQSELAKYTANCWLACQVTFANEMARVSAAYGAAWDDVRAAWLNDPRSAASHTRILDGGGFGGRCLPKDLAALIASSTEAGYEPPFLTAIRQANEVYRAQHHPEGTAPCSSACAPPEACARSSSRSATRPASPPAA